MTRGHDVTETNHHPVATIDPSRVDVPRPPHAAATGRQLDAPEWGMISFLVSEVAFFSTLIVVYLSFLGRDTVGPTPAEALSLPLVVCTTLCLLSSSVTIHLAERAAAAGQSRAVSPVLGSDDRAGPDLSARHGL